jgi:hypothetical protein
MSGAELGSGSVPFTASLNQPSLHQSFGTVPGDHPQTPMIISNLCLPRPCNMQIQKLAARLSFLLTGSAGGTAANDGAPRRAQAVKPRTFQIAEFSFHKIVACFPGVAKGSAGCLN